MHENNPCTTFFLDLVHSLSGINIGFYLYGSLFLGGGEKLDFFTPWGGSCTVSWGRLGGKFISFGGGGGELPLHPPPPPPPPPPPHPRLGLIPIDCSYISSLEQL